MRLIDADAIKYTARFTDYADGRMTSDAIVTKDEIDELPTIDVPDRKVGKWKPFDRTWGRSVWACDACGETVDVPTLNGKPIFDYCPWCGAKMTGDVKDSE